MKSIFCSYYYTRLLFACLQIVSLGIEIITAVFASAWRGSVLAPTVAPNIFYGTVLKVS